jgi:hypothetical protein
MRPYGTTTTQRISLLCVLQKNEKKIGSQCTLPAPSTPKKTVRDLHALLVQKYMLCWYEGTKIDTAPRITEANVAYALRALPLVLIPSLPRLLKASYTSGLVA